MARASMAALIRRLRRLISDTAGADQVWTDDDLQDSLDAYQTTHRYAPLDQEESRAATTGVLTYKRFFAVCGGDWEDDVEIVNSTYVAVTPDTEDLINGRWTFATEPDWPLLINGNTYDLYGAAADVLEEWAAKVKCQVDFSAEGQSMKLSQYPDRMLAMAANYRNKQKPQQGHLSRSDIRQEYAR
jgi:hypothetical protein